MAELVRKSVFLVPSAITACFIRLVIGIGFSIKSRFSREM